MKRLSAQEMLVIWESRMQYPAIERSLHLLSVLYNTDVETIGRLSIGERDARLIKFREWIFGANLMNVSHCPKCKTSVEWETDIRDILLQSVETEATVKTLHLEEEGYQVAFRLPNSFDIIEVLNNKQLDYDPVRLLSRCVLNIQHENNIKVAELPTQLIIKMEALMSEADPLADITMVLNCPECNHQWHSTFNILNYLWLEIDNWAKKLLREVASLARAFGWSERDILNLSYCRRRMYLDLIN